MEIVNAEDMQKMDVGAIHEYGIPDIILMKYAAMAVMDYIHEHVTKDSRIMILYSPGDNGGDGFALARLMVEEGYSHIHIYYSVPYDCIGHDETVYARIAESYGIEIMRTQDMEMVKPALDEVQVVVDTSFETGLSRNIEDFYDALILYLNLLNKHVINIDIASGVNGNTGSIMNRAIQSDVTIAFKCLKRRQLLYPGNNYCKDIVVENITLPRAVGANTEHSIHLLDEDTVQAFFPERDAHSHKGSLGKMMMVGGSSYMHGAIMLTTEAALQSRIGTLTLFLPDCISEVISMKLEENMLLPAPSMNGSFSMISVDLLKRNLDAYNMITIGNGMGRGEVTQAMVRVMLESDCPCLLDKDAPCEAGRLIELLHRPTVTVLTPCPKEMNCLCDCSMKEVLKDPLKCAMEFAKRYENTMLVSKGQHTIICKKDDMYMNTASDHALTKGDSGDMLCGILIGLYTQGKEALQATAAAVYAHTCVVGELTQRMDAYSTQPGDLIAVLSDTYGKLKRWCCFFLKDDLCYSDCFFPTQQTAYVNRRDNVNVSKDTTNKDGIMYNLIYLEGQKELPDHCIDAGTSFLYSL